MAGDEKLKVKNGIDPVEINSETEIGDLSYVFDINKETVKALSMANLPLALDDKFSNTPFLYFFNGIIPKDTTDKRIWYMGGHYLHIVKFQDSVFVNNLYQCNSLKLSKDNSHLICKDLDVERLINFDGTIRDGRTTDDICPNEAGESSISYGNCIIFLKKDSLRCKLSITWQTGLINKIDKQCLSAEIKGDSLYCKRKKLKNSEWIRLDGNCLTDSSVMTSPGVYDSSRNQKFKQFSTEAFDGKEPQSDSRKK